ncbi:MAG: hypothetical protein QM390_05030 [Candidatus Thermoplasmatota archaeon]|jgi:hypothetical protein|nr:hypothetical protein [Candidatus Thermoplasmatota archaeon]
MIEFTLSRVALGICGILLLASVIPFVESAHEDRVDDGMSAQAGSIAALVDSFWSSGSDSLTVCAGELLPTASSTLRFEGHFVILEYEGTCYKAAMLCDTVSEGTYSCNSILRLTRIGPAVAVEALGFT